MRKRNYEKKSLDSVFKGFNETLQSIFHYLKNKGNSKADDYLDDLLDYPSLTSILPYYSFDETRQIFINDKTIGFIIEITPLIGANESLVNSLDECLRTKLSRKIPLQISLLGSKEINKHISKGLEREKWKGENAEHFNAISEAFYQNAALNHFENGKNYGLTLRDYRVFITYAEDKKGSLETQLEEMYGTCNILKMAFEGSFLVGDLLGPKELLKLIREISNVDMTSTATSSDYYDDNESIDKQCFEKTTNLTIHKDHIVVSSLKKELGGLSETFVHNYMIDKNPDEFFLGHSSNNIASLLSPSLMISCPFIVSFIFEIEEQAKSSAEINTRFLDRDSKANSSFAKYVPTVRKEAEELGKLRVKISSNESAIAIYYYNITIFSSSLSQARKNEQDVLNTYRSNGIYLVAPDAMQFRNYLSMYPFMAQEGLWSDLKKSHATNHCESFNVANLMPIVADNRLAQQGFLAPSFRNQISFINLFGLGTDNFNCAITGTAGAGKSVLTQAILYDIYNNQGKIWIIDLGDSYKNFCSIVKGEYLDASTLKFNAFANIAPNSNGKKLAETLTKIKSLILVMADPEAKYANNVTDAIVLSAVKYAYKSKGNRARIDDVIEYLTITSNSPEFKEKQSIRTQMDELAIVLEKYSTRGIYGEYFNSDEPTLTSDVQLTVLELGALQGTPDLMAVVLYNLIISIDEYMYQSSRALMKVCAIDEAWRLLGGKSQRVSDFIEVGFRTARKHNGSFITITQGLSDFQKSQAAQAAWDNSSIKLIAKQDAIAIESFIQLNPNMFKPFQVDLLKSFGNASQNKFSAFLLSFNSDMHPCRLFLDPLRRTLFSSTGTDFDYIQSLLDQGYDISNAVYQRAQIKFKDELEELEKWIKARKDYTY